MKVFQEGFKVCMKVSGMRRVSTSIKRDLGGKELDLTKATWCNKRLTVMR